MTLDEFVFEIERGTYRCTHIVTYISVLLNPDKIHVFRVERESDKALYVSMVSKRVYGGQSKFWVPKAAFKKVDDWRVEPLQLKKWYLDILDDQSKLNIGLIW